MSTITKVYTICDKCGKEIKGKLITHKCPCCGADICTNCQSVEDTRQKPKIKIEREAEPLSIHPSALQGVMDEGSKQAPAVFDISTFEVKTPEPGTNDPYILSIEEVSVATMSLTEGLIELLDKVGISVGHIEVAPDSQGKRLIQGILSATSLKAAGKG